jgi:polyphosphate kinase
VTNLFHYLTGYAPEQEYLRLIVAPRDMRRRWSELIQAEIEHQEESGTGRIVAKMNGLDDVDLIQDLYRASAAGVQVDLVVRGICRLRPGLPEWSENIRVVSILGRFLEHDRIFHFHNNGDPRIFISSADWRRRNLEGRVEAALDVDDPHLKARLAHILELALEDNRLAWELRGDGSYRLRHPAPGDETRSFQETLMKEARERRLEDDLPWDIDPGARVVRHRPRRRVR